MAVWDVYTHGQQREMSGLGVNSDLAWIQATLTVHSTLPDKVCQAPPVLCFICVHTTQPMSTRPAPSL